jgi:CheY-like chemotaxis protein
VQKLGNCPFLNASTLSLRKEHALIVEDEVLIALGLKADLEALGFEVSGLAPNAKQAISLAMNDKPDLVVMDIYLNGARDGIEAARSLRETFGTQVIFVTAYSEDDGIMERIQRQVPDAPVFETSVWRSPSRRHRTVECAEPNGQRPSS